MMFINILKRNNFERNSNWKFNKLSLDVFLHYVFARRAFYNKIHLTLCNANTCTPIHFAVEKQLPVVNAKVDIGITLSS